MIETATGLVLRTRLLTETSLIVHWLTPTVGRLATVAKGARGPKSPFRGKLDLFYLADFSFVRSRRSELHTLREVKVQETHSYLRQDIEYLRQASYCAALIEQATETDTPIPGIYGLMRGFLAHLGQQPPRAQWLFAFEIKLLSELGLQPNWAETKLSPGPREAAKALEQMDWALVGRLQLNRGQAVELEQFLKGFFIYHLGKVPRGKPSAISKGR